MPPEGVQRGTLLEMDGDSLTPLYPSLPDLYPGRTIKEVVLKKNFNYFRHKNSVLYPKFQFCH